MKSNVINKDLKVVKSMELPDVFSSTVRPDILLKVYESQKLIYTQPYGIKKGAGAQYSASGIFRKKRHAWKGTYGKGISRIPRKIMMRNGASFTSVGATISSTRGGRTPHGPKPEKNRFLKTNKKELLIALKSAFVGTMNEKYIHDKYNKNILSGIIFDESILHLKSKDFFYVLKMTLKEGFEFAIKIKKVRAGKGKTRGRKYKSNAGLLFVIASNENMKRKGIDVVKANEITLMDLSPNGVAGRLTCYTENAIKEIGELMK